MREFMLKSYGTLNFIGFVLIIGSTLMMRSYFTWTEEGPEVLAFIYLLGFMTMLFSYSMTIKMYKLAVKQDEIDEKWKEYNIERSELDKFMEFVKKKAFESTVVSKDEVRKHMGWDKDDDKN